MTPISPIVDALVSRLEPGLREMFEELAGVFQFEASHPRELAECLAVLEVIRSHPLAVSGLDAIRDGEQVLLVTARTPALLGHSVDLVALLHGWDGAARLSRVLQKRE